MKDVSTHEPLQQLKGEAQHAEAVVTAQAQAGAAPPIVPRPVRRYRAVLFQAYIIIATIALAILLFYARTVAYFTFDLTIERWVQGFTPVWFDALMRFISELGFPPLAYLLPSFIIILVFFIGLRWEATVLTISVVGIELLGTLVKLLVQRGRPTPDLVNVFSPLSDYSFPSGHVLLFVGFLGFLFFLLYTLARHSLARTIGLLVIGALIALVGISRVYLGQHWPSDVLGAYLMGSVWLALMIYLYRWGKPRFFVNQPRAPEAAATSGEIKS